MIYRLFISVVFSLQLHLPVPAINVFGRSTTVTVGGDAILFCQMMDTKDQLTKITWLKRTRYNPRNEDIFSITPYGKTEDGLGGRVEFIGNFQEYNGSVRLEKGTLLDEGIYTCVFNIFPSGLYETEMELAVQVPPVVSVSTDVTPLAGDSEVILATCTAAKARPLAVISWSLGVLKDSVKVETNVSVEPDGSFTLKSHLVGVASRELNQQEVQCLVNHPSLNKELILEYELVIHYPPQIVSIISVNPPTTHQEFQCVADANPKPTNFAWSREKKALSGRVHDDKLEIPLKTENNGLYICKTSNQYGNGTATVYMNMFTGSSCTSCTVCWGLFSTLLVIAVVGCSTLLYLRKCFSDQSRAVWDFRFRAVRSDPDTNN